MNLDLEAQNRRRSALTLSGNPLPQLDYVATLSGRIAALAAAAEDGDTASLLIRYVPDTLVMEKSSLGGYLQVIGAGDWQSLEDVAAAILDDLNNELVPRWVHVGISGPEDGNGARHSVIVEDRQPNWDNPALLARLSPT